MADEQVARRTAAAARSAIGIVVVFGVSIATAVTLYIVPLLYRWLAPRTSSPRTVSRALRALKRKKETAKVVEPSQIGGPATV